MIDFHVHTLIYNFQFDLILRLYGLENLTDTNPIRYPQVHLLSWTWDSVIGTWWSRFFLIFCSINSHAALPEMTFVVSLWCSTRSLTSKIQVARFIASATPDPGTQSHQTLKTHHTHHNTCFQLTSQDKQDNSSQLKHTILCKSLGYFNATNIHIGPSRSINLCIWKYRLSRPGKLFPNLEQPDWTIWVDYSIPLISSITPREILPP